MDATQTLGLEIRFILAKTECVLTHKLPSMKMAMMASFRDLDTKISILEATSDNTTEVERMTLIDDPSDEKIKGILTAAFVVSI